MRRYRVSDRQAETSHADGKNNIQEKKESNTVLITDDTTIYEIDAECLREKEEK